MQQVKYKQCAIDTRLDQSKTGERFITLKITDLRNGFFVDEGCIENVNDMSIAQTVNEIIIRSKHIIDAYRENQAFFTDRGSD